MDALLTRAGWWIGGPAGYVGPTAEPPAGPPPHRAIVAGTQQWVAQGTTDQAEAEAIRRLGPDTRVVLEPMEPGRMQVWACEASLVAQVEAWPGLATFAPYARALRAGLDADVGPTQEPTLIVEPVGSAALFTVVEGQQVRACRWVDVPAEQWASEALRTAHGAGCERVTTILGPATVDAQLRGLGLPLRPLSGPALALRSMSRLPTTAWFLSASAAAAALKATERARSRSRRLALGAALALGLAGTVVSGLLRLDAAHTRRALDSREAGLRAQLDRLAIRSVAARLRPVPLEALLRVTMALPTDVGLREATLTTVRPGEVELELIVAASGEAWRDADRLSALLRDVLPGSEVHVAPVAVGNALVWQVRLLLPGARSA
jgi:hypothetical protein